MEKIWYVFDSKFHRGPYSRKELADLLKSGTISPQFPVWKEGMGEWIALESCHELSSATRVIVVPEQVLAVKLPDLPSLSEVPKARGQVFKEDVAVTNVNDVVPLFVEKPPVKKLKIFAALFVMLISITVIFLFLARDERDPEMAIDLARVDQILLEDTLKTGRGKGFEVAMSTKGSDLWVAIKGIEQAHLEMRMFTVAGKALSDESVVAIGKASMVNGIAKFKQITLVEGKKIVSGYYNVQIKGEVEGSKSKLKNLLVKFGLSLGGQDGNGENKSLSIDGEFLLAKNRAGFAEKLGQFNAELKEKKSAPISLMLEKYRTFYFLLGRLEEMFFETLKSAKTGNDIDKFKLNYAMEIAPILQNVIQDNDAKQRELSEIYPYAASEYQHLVEYGMQITALVGDTYLLVKQTKTMSENIRNSLKTSTQQKVLSLKQSGEGKIQQLQTKLDSL